MNHHHCQLWWLKFDLFCKQSICKHLWNITDKQQPLVNIWKRKEKKISEVENHAEKNNQWNQWNWIQIRSAREKEREGKMNECEWMMGVK